MDSTAFVPFGDLRRPQAPRQRHGLWTRHPLPLALTLRALSDMERKLLVWKAVATAKQLAQPILLLGAFGGQITLDSVVRLRANDRDFPYLCSSLGQ